MGEGPAGRRAGSGGPGAEWRARNLANWNERVPIHVASGFYDWDAFVAGADSLRSFEPDELGPVDGRSLVHLQCHFGRDTLSWARRGAEVTGLDFSEPALVEARRLAVACGLDARFVTADVYDAPAALGRTFDVVYTGLGALNWLPDLRRWAEVVDRLLRPGGCLYLVEFHPSAWMMADDDLVVAYDYFNDAGPFIEESGQDYADPAAQLENSVTVEWAHPLGEVVSALADAGLDLDFLHEFAQSGLRRWPWMEPVPGAERSWRMPAGRPSFPLEYSLRATKCQ